LYAARISSTSSITVYHGTSVDWATINYFYAVFITGLSTLVIGGLLIDYKPKTKISENVESE